MICGNSSILRTLQSNIKRSKRQIKRGKASDKVSLIVK